MAQGLLGGVLPAIYSGADQLKRGVYGLLTNPQEQAQRAAQSLLQSRAERQALMGQAFANPDRPFQVTDRNAMAQLGSDVLTGELGIAPVGMIAYHGSPFKFDKFDSTKIGSGEGAQAYGHGMYFAEARPTAETYVTATNPAARSAYMHLQANNGNINQTIKEVTKDLKNMEANQDLLVRGVLEQNKQKLDFLQAQKAGKPIETGSLYKVDIPDEQIPTMMDWDKPLGQQSDVVKKAINNLKKQVTPEMKEELGGDLNILFGKDITPSQFLNTWEIIHPSGGVGIGEKLLNEQGVKGIRYLDNASRDINTNYVVNLPNFGSYDFPTLKEAQEFIKNNPKEKFELIEPNKTTSNFVVFDPTDVKILERNNKPVEGLLD